MWLKIINWVDKVQNSDNDVAAARNRSQHIVTLLSFMIGHPYAMLLYMAGSPFAASLAVTTAWSSVTALFLLTRRGHPTYGGVSISASMLLAITIVLVSRGGLQSNSSIWLMLVPVLGVITTGPRTGLLMGGIVATIVMILWTLQSWDVVLSSSFSPEIAWILVAVDHVTVPISVAMILWGQHTVWSSVVERLNTTNDTLRKEVIERKQAERNALQAAEARKTFLATMSHEIRTPLNGVLGATDAILEGQLSSEQHRLASAVKHSGELLRNVLDDVLDFAKIDAGALNLVERPIQLEDLAQELYSLWSPSATEKETVLKLQFDPTLPNWIQIDDHRLRQVLGNLLSNAVKFTKSGTISLVFKADEGQLRIIVSDTGIGISPANLERIFQPFQQIDSTDRRQHGGTGLGLSICRRLIEHMGGKLDASSNIGSGTRFWFTLPLKPIEPPLVLPANPNHLQSLAGRRVLAAEDNPTNQMVLRAQLKRSQVELRIASDGLECIAMCEQELPELILMDCQMPNCDGYEATRRLREQGIDIPIVAVTASTMPGDRQRSLDAGMNEHLCKPIRAIELESILMQWLIK